VFSKLIKKVFRHCFTGGISFFDQADNNYILQSGNDAYGKINGQQIGVFERIKVNGITLNVGHFAVTSYEVGLSEGKGEKCLREFAALVISQNPNIQNINFCIFSTISKVQNDPVLLQKVADARSNLLIKVGATNVSINSLSPTCIEVRGNWSKQHWK
jgi:hypothetical protein